MSLWDLINVYSSDGETRYEEGVDYEIDYEDDTISRIPGGGIPDGGQVTVKYAKGVPGGVLDELRTAGEATLPPVKAILKILPSPDADLYETGEDLSGKAVRMEFRQTLENRPDELEIVLGDPSSYAALNPQDDVILAAAFGERDESGEWRMVECFRGLVAEREFIADPEGAHRVRIVARDFSSSLDAPRQGAMGRTWHPTLRREVFLNGALIADDYRAIRSGELLNSIEFDDILELHFAKEYPSAHEIIRDCFNAASSPFLDRPVIDCLDFPVIFMDGNDKTPGEVIREIASFVGASVRAEGTSLVIGEKGFPDGFKTCWVYDTLAVLDEGESGDRSSGFTAVQIFGHSETSRLPTKSAYLPPTDFTMPGWVRVVDESGTIEPDEPLRSDEYPQPAELTFQLDGGLYDPSSVRVLGAELAEKPSVEIVDGKPVINVTVLIPWNAIDKAGECPYIEDEFGNKLYRIRGRVFDAVPSSDGEHLPIPHASVRRERLDGENAGETFDTTADYDGFYSFEAVPEGKYKIIASSPGYLDNYSDDDPDNDETRDLTEELHQYEEEIEKGRYEKQATDYHVIVWARQKVEMGPLADLTVSQVILEVRLESTQHGAPLNYAPAVRDERITTEALAERIGKILLAGASQTSPATKIRTPLNKWLRAGDGIRLTGTQVDLSPPESRPFQVTELRKVFVPDEPRAHDIVSSAPGEIGASLARTFSEDPLGTKVGTVVAVYRNELGGRVYDVEAEGSVLYGLKAWPVLGDLMVGEMVQVSRATKGAISILIVARTTEIFGKERIVYV